MKIKNKKNKANYVNFKSNGMAQKIAIPAGITADVQGLTSVSQITNYGDFKRGFFEIISEEPVKVGVKEEKKASKKSTEKTKKKKKLEDSLDKVEKEVKDYTDNKDNK
jgi:hypothetical protein